MNRPGREVVGWVTRGRQDGESEVERRKGGEKKERKNDTLFTLRVKNDKKKLITRERKNKQEESH